jgi:hypothetical protein
MTVNAFVTWEGDGRVYRSGDKTGTFVGVIKGPLFVETEKGPFPAGSIVCPGMLQVNLETAEQSGTGQCTITANDGAQAYAAWSCRGVHLVGCDGRMLLTGGSGRVAGIQGGGSIVVRTTARGLVKMAADPDSVTSIGSGIMVMRGFKVEMPAAKQP